MAEPILAASCRSCGTPLAPDLLACPSCRALVHADELKRLAAEAERAESAGSTTEALTAWRQVVALLPAGATQQREIMQRVSLLSQRVDGLAATPPAPEAAPSKRRTGIFAIVATAALLLFKFKTVILFALTKGKFLLLGLTKAPTFLSMFVMFSVYTAAFGWKFTLGFVLSIYVHEMGHVYQLSRYGVKATAPMFVPGLGAFIRVQQAFVDVREEARSGLAGPLWGLGAALASFLLYAATGIPVLAAIARMGAWLNLFNLLPIWQLDGGRGFRAIAKRDRFIIAGVAMALMLVTGEGFYLILGLIAAGVAMSGTAPEKSDRVTVLEFVGLLIALAPFFLIPIEGLG